MNEAGYRCSHAASKMTTTDDSVWLVGATCVFLTAMLALEDLLCSSGARVPLYALVACLTMLPALYSSRPRRIWAVTCTFVVLIRLILDHKHIW